MSERRDEIEWMLYDTGCLGKEQFPSESAATAAAKVYAADARKRSDRRKQQPYPCRFADHWHLTGF